MTKEEAIHFAECLKNNWTINFADMEEFCDMAIEALQVEIVRCKMCKYYNGETKGCTRNPSVEKWENDDYCSYGEREEAIEQLQIFFQRRNK